MNNDIENAWNNFCEDSFTNVSANSNGSKDIKGNINKDGSGSVSPVELPKCSKLNISTTTKISYLNNHIDLKSVFWKIPLINYYEPMVGVVKKQMKFNSTTPEEVEEINSYKEKNKDNYLDDLIISQIHKPEGRLKYKDIRKLSIGICKKDITSYRCKKKSAFYNCFVVIMRILCNDNYKEIHVKVFNTGKLEIPGIQNETMLNDVLRLLVKILSPIVNANAVGANAVVGANPEKLLLQYLENKSETVMINSNFSCGYYINRENLYKLLKYKYKINSNFDPCSYPGIQCEFYYDSLLLEQFGIQPSLERSVVSPDTTSLPIVKVSFMIFRTGSVLIVGKCSESILYKIYDFLCNIFIVEYDEIKCVNLVDLNDTKSKKNVRKMRKKMVFV